MKFEQTRRDTIERENQKRMAELEGLRAELQRQAAEIDEYRRKIHELEISRERSRGLDDSTRQQKNTPQKPAVIVPSF